MKKLLLLGAAVLGLCTLGQHVQAGPDDSDYRYERPAPRVYEGRVIERDYCPPPPPPPVYYAPCPVVYGYGYPRYYHRRHFRPYGYRYGYAPGIHIGIGF